ncbi:MAG: hypothetical protein L3J09_04850 [Flavobacteriaceae bacterium]|nr:hypothetical protein [Flavobacteriaceae bacterium]
MKNFKQIITIVALAVFINTSAIANEVKTNNDINSIECNINNDTQITIGVSIVFGRKSRNCAGFGVCKITGSISITIKAHNNNGKFSLILTKEGLEEINNRFKGNKIILEEDYVLPESITKKIGLKKGYVLKTGTYSISSKKKDGTYSVTM